MQPMSDQEYLQLLDAAEPALTQFEQSCEAVSQSCRLQSIEQKLKEMGVLDVKVSYDGETWNIVPKAQRAEAVANVFEAYLAGEYSPMGKLND